MKKALLSILFLSLQVAWGSQAPAYCRIEFYPHLAKVEGPPPPGMESIKKSDCGAEVQRVAHKIVLGLTGRPSAHYLTKLIYDETSTRVEVVPDFVRVDSINDIVAAVFPEGHFAKEVNLPKEERFLILGENEELQANCLQCPKTGTPVVQLKIGRDKIIWPKVTKVQRAMGLVSKRSINSLMQGLDIQDFEYREVEVRDANELFTDRAALTYFRPSRAISQGEVLLASNVLALNLINAGTPLEVLYEVKGMQLVTKGVAMNAGVKGGAITVQLSNNKKIISARAVDFNKVVVE